MKKYFSPKNLLLIWCCILLVSCSSTSHIYIVRHAEKSAPSGNVPLSAAGLQRAEVLKDSLRLKKITAVYSTATQRTQQTVTPTAILFAKTIVTYNNGDSLLQVLSTRRNARTLVAGHSNTVPKMIRSLGLTLPFSGDIPDNEYDNLYIITIKPNVAPQLQVLKYGPVSH